VRKFTLTDHYHEKLDIPDSQLEFIEYINTKVQTQDTLPNNAVDTTMGTQEDPAFIRPEDTKIDMPTDNNETLPEHISNLLFIYTAIFLFRLRLNHFYEHKLSS